MPMSGTCLFIKKIDQSSKIASGLTLRGLLLTPFAAYVR